MRRGPLLLLLVTPVLACAPARAAEFPTTAVELNLRATPGGKTVGRVGAGTLVEITCQRNGPPASGRGGPTRVWDRVRVRGRRGWVGDGWVETGTSGLVAPLCGTSIPAVAMAHQGSCATVSPFALLAPFATPRDFVAAAAPGATASREQFGVPPSVTLAQGILETGGGRLAALANNFFGLKAQVAGPLTWRWEDIAGGCVFKKTREIRGGRSALEIAAFRAYATLDASILDHGRRLATNPVYRPAFDHRGDPVRFARAIARRYATDPAYGDKLVSLIERYDLTRFDE